MKTCTKNAAHKVNPASVFCPECQAPVQHQGGPANPTQPLPPTMVPQAIPLVPFRLIVDKTASMESINQQVAQTIAHALDEGMKQGLQLNTGVIFVRDIRDHGWDRGLVDRGYLSMDAAKKAIADEPTIGNSTVPESQLDAIVAAINGPWPNLRPGKARCIVLTTNSGTYDPTEDGVSSDEVVRMAQKAGARIFIIGPGGDATYKKLCDGTGGVLWDVDRMTPDMYVSVMKMLGKTITSLALAGS